MTIGRAAVYSWTVILMLAVAGFCGCLGPSEDTPSTQAIPQVQPAFVTGDIIAKTASSSDQGMLILSYNPATGEYERAIVSKTAEGGWFRRTSTSEFVDRALMEKVYPAKIGHVTSLSRVPVETPPVTYLPAPAEPVLSPSAATGTLPPIITRSPSTAPVTTRPATTLLATRPGTGTTPESTVYSSSPALDILALEQEIHTLINQERSAGGISGLSYDSSLASVARNHSADMARNNYFSHYDPEGLDPTARGSAEGYTCNKNSGSVSSGIAENIMQNTRYDSVMYYNGVAHYAWNSPATIARSTVDSWMSSAGHRETILSPAYDREGIGVATAGDTYVYITEDFC
jgi:uncharacterized protein YkwD